jgi:hypothetical protein
MHHAVLWYAMCVVLCAQEEGKEEVGGEKLDLCINSLFSTIEIDNDGTMTKHVVQWQATSRVLGDDARLSTVPPSQGKLELCNTLSSCSNEIAEPILLPEIVYASRTRLNDPPSSKSLFALQQMCAT